MRCQTEGCTHPTRYGGCCPACEILFGSYARLLCHYPEATFAEETPVADETEAQAQTPLAAAETASPQTPARSSP